MKGYLTSNLGRRSPDGRLGVAPLDLSFQRGFLLRQWGDTGSSFSLPRSGKSWRSRQAMAASSSQAWQTLRSSTGAPMASRKGREASLRPPLASHGFNFARVVEENRAWRVARVQRTSLVLDKIQAIAGAIYRGFQMGSYATWSLTFS
jgi:hypothetical protein